MERMGEIEMGLSVVIPTLNEAACLGELLFRTARALGEIPFPKEMILVDDDSPDGTAYLAESLSPSLPVPLRVLRRRGPRSLSLSVLEGARVARYPWVAVLDADLSHDPGDLPRVIEPIISGSADLSVGSRYAVGGAITRWPVRRRLLSRLGTAIARRLTHVRDPLSGFFACRKALLDGSIIALRPSGYKILLEVLVRFRGQRVFEVPIRFRDRHRGKSKFGLRQGFEFLLQILKLSLSRAKRVLGRGDVVFPPTSRDLSLPERIQGEALLERLP